MPRWSPFEPYFWSLVEKGDGCWTWKSGTDGNGYARVWYKGKRQPASRVACELSGKPRPGALHACHTCDNKLCVNPAHIFWGTAKDNMQDWTKKGKNRLANDRTLWGMGKHWATNPAAKRAMSAQMRMELSTGQRIVLRGEKGRILGTRRAP
jgi:hypothetical protein